MKYIYDSDGNLLFTKRNAEFKAWAEMVDIEHLELKVTDRKVVE